MKILVYGTDKEKRGIYENNNAEILRIQKRLEKLTTEERVLNVGQFKWRDIIMVNFILGAMFGATVGLITSALLMAAKRGDNDV